MTEITIKISLDVTSLKALEIPGLFPLKVLEFFVFPRRLLGIITKKDVLRHMAQMMNQDPESIMFN